MYYVEVIPGLVCVLFLVDIKSGDYFSPCTHLSGAIPVNSESGCWCIEPGCEAKLTDVSSPIIFWFLLRDEFNMHAVEPALFSVACCMLLPCCGLPVSVMCRWKGSRRTCPSAARLSSYLGGRVEDVCTVWSFAAVIPGAEFCFERSPDAVGEFSPAGLLTLCCPRPCGGYQGTLEIWSLASHK